MSFRQLTRRAAIYSLALMFGAFPISVALANSLGLDVIAEGVETEEQRAFLARNHCHSWQGYLLSKPIPAADFEQLVREYNQG